MNTRVGLAAVMMLGIYTGCGAVESEDEEDALEEAFEGEPLDDYEPDAIDPHEALTLFLEGGELDAELETSPVHTSAEIFDRLALLYEGTEATKLELQHSNDGESWSPWTPVLGEDGGDGTFSAELLFEGGAAYFRLRARGEARPAFLSIELGADLAEEISLEDEMESAGEAYATSGSGLFKRYRFDLGKVSRPWLWLLRKARSEGWRGRLAGTRTGLRTYKQQNQLYQAYLNGTGAPAFPPWGPSRHLIRNVRRVGRWYMAIDTQDVGRLIRIARRHGVSLRVPYSNEPWHVEATRYFRHPKGWTP